MNESQLLSALEQLTQSVEPGRKDGYRTTSEMAKALAEKDGLILESAKKRVREMLLAAQELGRLDSAPVRVVALGGHRTVAGYKLRTAPKPKKC